MTAPGSAPGHPLRPDDPTRLGAYTLYRRLGEGGMGTVYLGRSTDGRPVAVKVIRREFAQVAEFRRRFEREAASALRVRRFCTAEVLDVGAEGEQPYLVTEFVEGRTLSDVIAESGPLSPANLEGLAVGVAVALTAIHGAGIVHRDLKPGNVMLSPYGLRVIDFGIARASDAVNATQVRVGTPAFMAPEQVLDKALTPALDIFAWGAVVTYAGTGRLPFGGGGDTLFERILTAPPDLAGLQGHDVLLPIVEQAMRKDPAERPTADELLYRLTGSTGAAGPGGSEAAMTRVLAAWPAPVADPRRAEPATTGPLGALPPDPHRTPYHPPTAATRLPGAGDAGGPPTAATVPPSGPARVPPPPGGGGPGWTPTGAPPAGGGSGWTPPDPSAAGGSGGGRLPAAPPARPFDTPGPPSDTDTAFVPPPAPRRRGRLVAVIVAVVVVAALVVGGVLLSSSDDDPTPRGEGSSSPGTPTSPVPSTSPVATTPVSVALPRSAALPVGTVVAAREGAGLLAVPVGGAGATSLGDSTGASLPSLSPDRGTVAFLAADGSLQVVAADGSGARALLVGPAEALRPCAGSRIGWSPDGTQVAVCASGPDGSGLYVVNPTTGVHRHLAQGQERVGDPAWSPRGDLILYWAAGTGDAGPLYTIAADGSAAPTKLTDGPDAQPVWAPNAGHIAFRRTTGRGDGDIVGCRSNGDPNSIVDFTQGSAANDSDPSFSPVPGGSGGDIVVFASDRSGAARLYTFDFGAPRPVPVTEVPGQTDGTSGASWSSGARPG